MKTTAAVLLSAAAVALPLAGCASDTSTTAGASSPGPTLHAHAMGPVALATRDMTQPTSICPVRRP